jgi:hypothetical protein
MSSQLEKIGTAKAKILADRGFDTAAKLIAASVHELESALNQKHPAGSQVHWCKTGGLAKIANARFIQTFFWEK